MTMRFLCIWLQRNFTSPTTYSLLVRAPKLKVDGRFLFALKKNLLSRETIWVKLLQFVLCIQCVSVYFGFVRHTVGSLTFFEVRTQLCHFHLGIKLPIPTPTAMEFVVVIVSFFTFISLRLHNEILANYTERLMGRSQ